MNNALSQVFALQQKELEAKRQREQADRDRRAREINALQNSGILQIFAEFADTDLRRDTQARSYQKTLAGLVWDHYNPAHPKYTPSNVLSFKSAAHGNMSGSGGPRWACQEDRDSGRMLYSYTPTNSSGLERVFREPAGEWLDAFVQFVAACCDPDAVSKKMQDAGNAPATRPATRKRRLQPTQG
jgi:hypothetical protein